MYFLFFFAISSCYVMENLFVCLFYMQNLWFIWHWYHIAIIDLKKKINLDDTDLFYDAGRFFLFSFPIVLCIREFIFLRFKNKYENLMEHEKNVRVWKKTEKKYGHLLKIGIMSFSYFAAWFLEIGCRNWVIILPNAELTYFSKLRL